MARKLKKDQEEIGSVEAAEVETPTSELGIEHEGSVDGSVMETSTPVCGLRLREARIAQDLSTQAVAKQLRLSNKQIEALEADDFAALPEPTIVKGFIRNYAKLLKIPAETMLSAYTEMTPEAVPYAVGINSGINMKMTEKTKSSNSRYIWLAILFLLSLGVWFFYQSYIQKPATADAIADLSDALPAVSLQMPKTIEEAASPVEEAPLLEQEEMQTVEVSSSESADMEGVLVDDAQELPVASTEVATSEETGDAAQAEPSAIDEDEPPSVVGKTRLEFNATQETWLSVVDASGKEVYNKILYEGNRDVIDVYQPKEIVVGNAHGATLVVDGKPINLAPYTRINVARVRLDD